MPWLFSSVMSRNEGLRQKVTQPGSLGLQVYNLGFKVEGSGFNIHSLGFQVYSLGFEI